MSLPLGWTKERRQLETAVTGRSRNMFEDDLHSYAAPLYEAVQGRRCLLLGAAGSIGSEVSVQLAKLGVGHLVLIDQDENSLVRLVRRIRSDPETSSLSLDALPLKLENASSWHDQGGIDHVLNFSAVKHVRSEGHILTAVELLTANFLGWVRFLESAQLRSPGASIFSLSTDKAADPVSLLGASKRLMEDVTLYSAFQRATSARFANVAFSAGSLLESWHLRLGSHHPLSVPRNLYRYLISHEEAATLCLLGAFVTPTQSVLVPSQVGGLTPLLLQDALTRLLEFYNFEPSWISSWNPATMNIVDYLKLGRYPCVVSEPDTDGEKLTETFVGQTDALLESPFSHCDLVIPRPLQAGAVDTLITALDSFRLGRGSEMDLPRLRELVMEAVPQYEPQVSGKTLNDRV